MMLLSVLMMPNRCLVLWEQMGLLCMSAITACCAASRTRPCQHASVLMCLFTGPSGRRRGVRSCCILAFFFFFSCCLSNYFYCVTGLPLSHKKGRRSACLDVSSGGFGHLISRSRLLFTADLLTFCPEDLNHKTHFLLNRDIWNVS